MSAPHYCNGPLPKTRVGYDYWVDKDEDGINYIEVEIIEVLLDDEEIDLEELATLAGNPAIGQEMRESIATDLEKEGFI